MTQEEHMHLQKIEQRRSREEHIKKFALTLLEQCKSENLSMQELDIVLEHMRTKASKTTLRAGLAIGEQDGNMKLMARSAAGREGGGIRMEQKINLSLDSRAFDDAIEKANRLVELLREVQQIVDSLSGTEKSEA